MTKQFRKQFMPTEDMSKNLIAIKKYLSPLTTDKCGEVPTVIKMVILHFTVIKLQMKKLFSKRTFSTGDKAVMEARIHSNMSNKISEETMMLNMK